MLPIPHLLKSHFIEVLSFTFQSGNQPILQSLIDCKKKYLSTVKE